MRAETGPSAGLAESSGFLDVRLQDCRADLLASTVANIGPFLEDEFSVDGQPMRLHMCNITITMKVGHFLLSNTRQIGTSLLKPVQICLT